jgi:uncharacterized protein
MSPARSRVHAVLDRLDVVAVAVSGGIDSLTLATLAGRRLGAGRVLMVHAVSPAVPPQASTRVREFAAREGWRLEIVSAGEFSDPDYLRNPVDRCFFCKINLYGAIAAVTSATILSGANLDDLADYRPGLDAARRHGVRHPYIEAQIDKATVRSLARDLGLGDIAELPASPCLASRVETGIAIDPATLRFINCVELMIGAALAPRTVRCRVRTGAVVIELDEQTLGRLADPDADGLRQEIATLWPPATPAPPIRFAPYRTGSAFIGAPAVRALAAS